MLPLDPVNSISFNLTPYLPHFHGFFLYHPLPGLFGMAMPSSPLGVPNIRYGYTERA
jgi:hypothetical protein